MSEENKSAPRPKRNNRNRRPRKNPNKGNSETKSAAPAGGAPKSAGGAKKRRNNSSRKPKALTPAKVLLKYENLMEQYIQTRAKFFDLVGREKKQKQLEKVKRNYDKSLNDLRSYESKLNDWQKEVLDKKINAYPEDRHYTTANNIEPTGDIVSFTGDFDCPHLLPTQKSEDWAADTEESSGSMEDYEKYKSEYKA